MYRLDTNLFFFSQILLGIFYVIKIQRNVKLFCKFTLNCINAFLGVSPKQITQTPCEPSKTCDKCTIPAACKQINIRRCDCEEKRRRKLSITSCDCNDKSLDETQSTSSESEIDDSNSDEEEFCECCSCGCEANDNLL